ncbi:MAG: hypothetical protein AAF645_17820 [Myxococcota bacterium]
MLLTLSACSTPLRHTVNPDAVAYPAAEVTHLIQSTAAQRPLNVEVVDGYIRMIGFWGPNSIDVASLEALELYRRRNHFAVLLYAPADRRIARFLFREESDARRFCDAMSALHRQVRSAQPQAEPS